MRMSTARRRVDPSRRRRRAGLSLMEVLVVLAVFGLATAVVLPGSSRMLDQAAAHAVFFEFQREVSDLRREANRTGVAIRIIDPAVEPDPQGEDRIIALRAPWRYTLAPALEIAEGGACSPASANLVKEDEVVMTLRAGAGDCRFIRLVSEAGPTRGSSSR